MNATELLADLARAVRPGAPPPPRRGGRVSAHDGAVLEAVGLELPVGSVCAVGPGGAPAEVIGFRQGRTVLMGLAPLGPQPPGAAAVPLPGTAHAQVGAALLGRVIGGSGAPLDGGGRIAAGAHWPLEGRTVSPLARAPVREVLDVGVRAINGLLTLGRGQRVGIMAGTGVGKSVLLGMMARGAAADVAVVALIGERGREIADFVQTQLDPATRLRTVVVAVPADEAPLLRVRGLMRALAIAEFFRSEGRQVLLIVDSLTRVAHAQREIGLALGESPSARGYPPSALALLPALIERCGNDAASGGSITAIATVLTEGDNLNDPVADTARGVLDGHIVLSRAEAQRGLYPAIDVGASISRVMGDLVTREHAAAAAAFRRAAALVEANRDLLLMGAYAPGADPELDAALARRAAMDAWRAQDRDAAVDFADSVATLQAVMAG